MTEQACSILCSNCNKPILPGDESVSITLARERIEEGYIQPIRAYSMLDLCTDCAPLSLCEKIKEINIPIGVFNEVVLNRPVEMIEKAG